MTKLNIKDGLESCLENNKLSKEEFYKVLERIEMCVKSVSYNNLCCEIIFTVENGDIYLHIDINTAENKKLEHARIYGMV